MSDNDPHPQDEEFAAFCMTLPQMSDRMFIMTLLEMLTMDGSAHPNRWRQAMHEESKARRQGKLCPAEEDAIGELKFQYRLLQMNLSPTPPHHGQ